jgi:hypothetical protein
MRVCTPTLRIIFAMCDLTVLSSIPSGVLARKWPGNPVLIALLEHPYFLARDFVNNPG